MLKHKTIERNRKKLRNKKTKSGSQGNTPQTKRNIESEKCKHVVHGIAS